MEKEALRILLVDQDTNDHHLIRRSLERSGVPADLKALTSTAAALRRLHPGRFDLIVTDHTPPSVSAIRLLQAIRQTPLETPVILLSHQGEIQTAREVFKLGASDFLLKEELEAISLVDVISSVLEVNRLRQEALQLNQLLKDRAERDGLTGLYNHRRLLELVDMEFLRASRYGRPFSILMIDLDGFKGINDTLGHQKGDWVLKRTAELLKRNLRNVDILSRYGGDEFVAVLPETSPQAAFRLGERILREIRQNPYLDGERIFPLSASIGVASYHPKLSGAGALLREADLALYAAKRRGRNQVILGGSQLPPEDGFSDTHRAPGKPLS